MPKRRKDSIEAERKFRALMESEGYAACDEYVTNRIGFLMECPNGHRCKMSPGNFMRNHRCSECAGNDPVATERKFRALMQSEGYIARDEYIGSLTKFLMECPRGHLRRMTPSDFVNNKRRCGECAGNDSIAAEQKFRALMQSEGYIARDEYINNITIFLMECPKGHLRKMKPGNFMTGRRCGECSGHDSIAAERKFRALMESEGYSAHDEYVDSATGFLMECPKGHLRKASPASFIYGHRCGECAGNDSMAAEQKFRALMESEGYSAHDEYVDSATGFLMECPKGHLRKMKPGNFMYGYRCGICRGRIFDVFYVVLNKDTGIVKFGITSGDPRPRLSNHARNGFNDILRVITNLQGGMAKTIEDECKIILRKQGFVPVRGTEYFNASALPVILATSEVLAE